MRLDFTSLAHLLGVDHHGVRTSALNPRASGDEPIIGFTDEGQPVRWSAASIQEAGHVVCFAGSGAGKSTLLGNAIAEEIGRGQALLPREAQPAAFVIIPKSDFRVVLEQAMAAVAPASLTRLVVLNPFSRAGFPFNVNRLRLHGEPIEVRAWKLSNLVAEVSTSTGLLRSGSAGAGARQIDVLNHLLLAALTVDDPRANVLLAYDALITPQGFERLAGLSTSERARGFLSATKLGDELAAGCAARLRMAFAATNSLERMLSASSTVQFDELTSPGTLCLIDLGEPFGMPGLQSFWAGLFASLGIDHALARPAPFAHGHHLRIVIDEVQTVASVLAPRAESLAATGRARNVSLIVASQSTVPISRVADALIPTLMANAPTRIVGRLAAQDAELLSAQLAPSPGNTERPKHLRERFSAATTNLPDRHFWFLAPGRRQRFTSRPIDLTRWEAAADRQADLIAAAARRFALPASMPPRTTLTDLTPHVDARSMGRSRPQVQAVPDLGDRSAPEPARSRWG